jgi:enamine deaminase RidA (YjgF/YER057c/UK114 family)
MSQLEHLSPITNHPFAQANDCAIDISNMTTVQYTQVSGPVGVMYMQGGISHATIVPGAGKRVVTSGEAGLDLTTGKLVTSSLEAQIRAAFELLDCVLKGAGVGKGVGGAYKITALVLDMANEQHLMHAFHELYPGHRPTFMTFAVAGLALEGMEVELQAEAWIE